jgi:hypothetical protein
MSPKPKATVPWHAVCKWVFIVVLILTVVSLYVAPKGHP